MYQNFTNKYAVSKTLRFELVPQGKTLEYLYQEGENGVLGILEEDKKRAEDYKSVKKIIDAYHKEFISEALEDIFLEGLEKFELLYINKKRSVAQEKEFQKCQESLRKQIVKKLKAHENFSKLNKKELFSQILPKFVNTQDELDLVDSFGNFTTYFKGYFENRMNMYSDEDKSTAIAYRIVHQNLPMFIDNLSIFEKCLDSQINEDYMQIEKELAIILGQYKINEIFTIEYFNKVLSQQGIDRYNQLLGGFEDGVNKQYKGLNQYINLYNQQVDKPHRIGQMKILYKQILSDRESLSFAAEEFKSDKDVLGSIGDFIKETEDTVMRIEKLCATINQYELDRIYVKSGAPITAISQVLFTDWGKITQAISDTYDMRYKGKKKINTESYDKEKTREIKSRNYYKLGYLNEVIRDLDEELNVANYYMNSDVFSKYRNAARVASEIICDYPEDKKLAQDKDAVNKIKQYLDSAKEIQHLIKPLICDISISDKDENFYGELENTASKLELITLLYNKTRNYMSKKPYSNEKIKLNFSNPQLLGGWPIKREIATSSLIFKDEQYYYLGIMNVDSKAYFKNYPKPQEAEESIFKMKYLQAADPQKDVQNLMVIEGETVKKNGRKETEGPNTGENLLLEELKNTYLPETINYIRKSRSYSKGSENFSKEDLVKFIDYYKDRVVEYFSDYHFEFLESSSYSDFGKFTDHINQQAYQVTFDEISKLYIDQLVAEGKLYLFKIYNKDFSEHSKGTPNMHTLYWKMLFDERNLKNTVYKLNGEAEMFYRPASIRPENRVIHKANEDINNKNPNNTKRKSQFQYDIVKDKRYTADKFQLHVPITLNFKAEGVNHINQEVNKCIQNTDNIHVIGIDRGERNLLYISVIDAEGKIVEQFSLNEIMSGKNKDYKVDYHQLLDTKEKERENARKEWKAIENIKELKEGYLSQVIHVISCLMVKYNAIVVLEDLNFGFMRGRQKFEKQIYQKFEKQLIDKLNYLVDKQLEAEELGGLLNAFQLTNKFESFQKMGKQNGFLYYIPAWNTSKMDPSTGFVNLLYTKYKNVQESKAFVSRFENIRYNSENQYYEFAFDYNDFTYKASGSRTKWVLCSKGTRVISFRNKNLNNAWDCEEVDLTNKFSELFDAYGIEATNNIQEQILNQTEAAFYKQYMKLMGLMLQIRNSIPNTNIDYLLSPVANKAGIFYDSRIVDNTLPNNADANGAYNIARKGLWIIQQIKDADDDGLRKIKLAISNQEWLKYAQELVE